MTFVILIIAVYNTVRERYTTRSKRVCKLKQRKRQQVSFRLDWQKQKKKKKICREDRDGKQEWIERS